MISVICNVQWLMLWNKQKLNVYQTFLSKRFYWREAFLWKIFRKENINTIRQTVQHVFNTATVLNQQWNFLWLIQYEYNYLTMQPHRGVPSKRWNMQQICRRTPITKCDFNKVALQLRHGCSPVNLLYIFRTAFLKNTSGRLLLTMLMSITAETLPKSFFPKTFFIIIANS